MLSLEHKKAFFIILFVINFLFLYFAFYMRGFSLSVFLSFEFAFLGVFIIILLSFLSYHKKITLLAKQVVIIKKPLAIFQKKVLNFPKNLKFSDINDDFETKKKLNFRNFVLFFSFFKMLAYVFFVLGFLFLQKQELLVIFAFIVGIFGVPFAVLLFALSVFVLGLYKK
ncbi:hypothetical protein DMB92_03045 [Campylobacter sp. MIT 99-7217]|uniref:hypothetical protein n=1 Tax=Campylobacter sp. MIT 99-7217 TaxID=535091 RepID=UPI00115702E0|nr:hypothetical protein [Campylobacter sp. MIT 99-7217]TQR32954.1 hypothetical protein DMB92_03045 [Campylobacter sp. MIT 99-7217]